MSKVTVNDLLSALQAYRAQETRPTGEGWYTLSELAEQAKSTPVTMRKRIDGLIKQGIKVESQKGMVLLKCGRLNPTTYYRLGNGR